MTPHELTPDTTLTTAASLEPHQDEHLIWMLNAIAEWLEYHATDATLADLVRFLNHPNPRGAILHIIDTAALWATELQDRRSQMSAIHRNSED
jgi:hypothetical protein